jgi:hypothetical protein
MLDLGAPKRISSSGGILMYPDATPNTPDTQIATFDFGEMQVVWNHRIWGEAPDPKYLWGFAIYGDKGTLKGGLMSYDFTPLGNGTPIHKDVTYELEEYPEDKTEKDLEKHVAPAIRGHMKNFLSCIGTREKPVADIEQGYISSTACILANMSLKLGRSITWDNESGQIVGDEEANKMLSRPYRAPWVHPTAKSV